MSLLGPSEALWRWEKLLGCSAEVQRLFVLWYARSLPASTASTNFEAVRSRKYSFPLCLTMVACNRVPDGEGSMKLPSCHRKSYPICTCRDLACRYAITSPQRACVLPHKNCLSRLGRAYILPCASAVNSDLVCVCVHHCARCHCFSPRDSCCRTTSRLDFFLPSHWLGSHGSCAERRIKNCGERTLKFSLSRKGARTDVSVSVSLRKGLFQHFPPTTCPLPSVTAGTPPRRRTSDPNIHQLLFPSHTNIRTSRFGPAYKARGSRGSRSSE